MKIRNVFKRCGYCWEKIEGEPFIDDGVYYCSGTCRELAIDKKRRRAWDVLQSPWYIVLAILAMLVTMAITDKAMAHDIYHHWRIPTNGKSCCNMQDCKPAQARFERGSWWAFIHSRQFWVKIPDENIVRYKTDDMDAHLCYQESTSTVLCFRPPPTGM